MAEKLNIDQSLLDQKLNDFISNHLVPKYVLSYTEFKYDYNTFDFYMKFVDLLRPGICYYNNTYQFNKHIVLRLNTRTLYNKAVELPQEDFDKYLREELLNNKEYIKYITRLGITDESDQ